MEWINVNDRLPSEYQDVMLYQEFGGIFIGWLENGKWVVDNTFVETDTPHATIKGNVRNDEILYWRTLPPNPQWDFFEIENKPCAEWLMTCKNNVKVIDFKADTESKEFDNYWNNEAITRDEFTKRLMNCTIERHGK